jgi:putative AlgH/UPF0301 family transcriptional regulator
MMLPIELPAADAMVAAKVPATAFKNGRQMSVWIGIPLTSERSRTVHWAEMLTSTSRVCLAKHDDLLVQQSIAALQAIKEQDRRDSNDFVNSCGSQSGRLIGPRVLQ